MKKSELKQIIHEEINDILDEDRLKDMEKIIKRMKKSRAPEAEKYMLYLKKLKNMKKDLKLAY